MHCCDTVIEYYNVLLWLQVMLFAMYMNSLDAIKIFSQRYLYIILY